MDINFLGKAALLSLVAAAMLSAVGALDINSTTDLRYYPDSDREFQVDTSGNAILDGELNVSGNSGQIASFESNQITLDQPLSVESSGPLSVDNGIDLTGTSTNTIDSYSTLYLQTSSGYQSDIVLEPSGVTDVDSNLTVRGKVEVPTGAIKGNRLTSNSSTDSYVDIVGSGSDSFDAQLRFLDQDGGVDHMIRSGADSALTIQTGYNGGAPGILDVRSNIDVGGRIQQSDQPSTWNFNIDSSTSSNADTNFLISNDGNQEWDLYLDDSDADKLKLTNKDGGVSPAMVWDSSGNVDVPNGNIVMNDNNLINANGGTFDEIWTGDSALEVKNYNGGSTNLKIQDEGDVQVPNGDIQLAKGNRIRFGGQGSNGFEIYNEGGSNGNLLFTDLGASDTDVLRLKDGGGADLLNGGLDVKQNQIKNPVIDKRSSDPGSPAVGQMWYRKDLD